MSPGLLPTHCWFQCQRAYDQMFLAGSFKEVAPKPGFPARPTVTSPVTVCEIQGEPFIQMLTTVFLPPQKTTSFIILMTFLT